MALLISAGADINLPDNSDLKETPLLACNNDRHRVDKRSLLFLLNNGANPNIGNANNETPLHLTVGTFRSGGLVEEAIETLLLYGANPDILSSTGKKPIDMIVLPWEKNNIPLIFAKFKPQKHNLIDVALDLALSDKNRIIFAAALKNDLGIMSALIESLQGREDLTPFSKNRLAFLKLLQNDPIVANKKEFSSIESEVSGALIHRLYEVDLDIISAVSRVSNQWEDTKRLHKAAAKIQFWYRRNKVSILDENSTHRATSSSNNLFRH